MPFDFDGTRLLWLEYHDEDVRDLWMYRFAYPERRSDEALVEGDLRKLESLGFTHDFHGTKFDVKKAKEFIE